MKFNNIITTLKTQKGLNSVCYSDLLYKCLMTTSLQIHKTLNSKSFLLACFQGLPD